MEYSSMFVDDEDMAQHVAEFCYYPYTDKRSVAVKLLMERVFLPDDVLEYDIDIMKNYILKYLENWNE